MVAAGFGASHSLSAPVSPRRPSLGSGLGGCATTRRSKRWIHAPPSAQSGDTALAGSLWASEWRGERVALRRPRLDTPYPAGAAKQNGPCAGTAFDPRDGE